MATGFYEKYRVELVDPAALADDIRWKAMRKTTAVVRKYVRREAPKRSGKLRSSIQYRVKQRGAFAAVYGGSPHAHLVIGGTRPHLVSTKHGAWQHPGAKANPFQMRGAEKSRPEVERTLQNLVGR